ncbi:uncharacterized protein PHALS_14964 [Plasmopara halstedii]|uniref:Uncharacterized protein n=1 Tax=Plasmopara halstedii TaxID=4781 RepID=A0A0P1AXC6_PLAHL|nr:uncharacterized protein PHALS_14964 [Plasmopara halstedii]CEG47098.1 hypothetical protein PHALS_14964 [Plasmopara halstedii]|eukprot:XP_024583467.1 hypothetical protein PHALS_14964 [Plasmopara halstedii]
MFFLVGRIGWGKQRLSFKMMLFRFYLTVALFDVVILRNLAIHLFDLGPQIHHYMNHREQKAGLLARHQSSGHDREFGGGVSHHS